MLDRAFKAVESMLERSGYGLAIGVIDQAFLEFQLHAAKKRYPNPEFDPTLHDLDDGNSFWVRLTDREGSTVAVVAGRRCEIDGLLRVCESYELWYGDKIRFSEPLEIVYRQEDRLPRGLCAYDGAMWIRPDHRTRGLPWALGRLSRLTSIRRWEPEWIFGFAFEHVTGSRLLTAYYGYPYHALFATGFKFPGHPDHSLHLATMTRAEALLGVAADLEELTARPDLVFDRAFAQELKEQGTREPRRPSV